MGPGNDCVRPAPSAPQVPAAEQPAYAASGLAYSS